MSSAVGIAPKNPDLANIDPDDIYSVTELSRNIKQVFSATPKFNDILLKGEISNFVQAASGHIYFNLKDESCVIACAFFRHLQTAGCDDLAEGLQVVAMGSVVVYETRSQYQLSIKKVIPIGNGISSLKLKRLSEKLEAEGLFSQDRKKPIPCLPRKVGIITSKDSAAIKDILSVVNLRCPTMNLVMAYVALQGEGAPQSINQALSSLSRMKDIDAIILARGGGPSEDFMAFNDEGLVRAIASFTKPIITGIGHESDVCLADLAADLRASTPSTAARAAIPDIQELWNSLNPLKLGLERSYKSYLLALDAKEMEAKARREELQKLRNGLRSLSADLDRSYNAYLLGLKIREKEVEMGKKDDEIKQALLKYKAVIVALIAFLVLIILLILLRG
ncbi:MAG: exodeoxyribonuclease VII large subunit [Methanothrix sp.]|nr:MAG: exodeoxyribonuclease VII large subunit [Methanothrix sp.]